MGKKPVANLGARDIRKLYENATMNARTNFDYVNRLRFTP